MEMINVDTGVRLAVTDINPKGCKTVVFLHGWPLAKEIFEYQTEVLPRCGVRCVCVDMRGYGDSDKPWGGYSYDRMADDLHKVITTMNLKCVTLFGFSMGGAVCVRYLARHGAGPRVNRLVLCGAACPRFVQGPGYPYGKTVAEVNELISSCCHDRPDTVADFGKTCFASGPSREFLGWITSLCDKASGYGTIKGLEALRDEDLSKDLCKITVPTAIFHGVHDRVCPYVFSSYMNQGIADSYIVPFEQSGHALFYDEKEKCNASLLEFMKVDTGL